MTSPECGKCIARHICTYSRASWGLCQLGSTRSQSCVDWCRYVCAAWHGSWERVRISWIHTKIGQFGGMEEMFLAGWIRPRRWWDWQRPPPLYPNPIPDPDSPIWASWICANIAGVDPRYSYPKETSGHILSSIEYSTGYVAWQQRHPV